MPHNFWMIVCNPENFRITRGLNFSLQGLKGQHQRKIQRIEPGDRILFYVSQARRFTATATATSSFFPDDAPIWQKEGHDDWPYRIHIKPEVVLEEFQYIDANLLAPRLEYIKRWPPENWYMAFQGNLHLLPKSDFLLIEDEMKKLKFGREYVLNTPSPAEVPSSKKKREGYRRRQRPAASASEPGQQEASK